ncbi:ABC transporter substrate-binding protein [Oenococcus oeni]|uniref:ABC transporter substrate-binding protein n=1 Tax=Oenococcus oeni TaxID=1247 RepID=UPI0008F84260|nr:ABC transporter substrate-binding protein [Oenococcus oeni]OIM24625.1 ABC transporter substrate-binding protein [Oenococcus oeni]OLQ40850.1 ABC transporter substrate-binding protein [Oenococcus oeni]
MKTRNRIIMILLLLAVVGTMIFGGVTYFNRPSAGKDSKRITINFWSFWGSGARKDVINAIIKDFNSSQDRVKVKYTYQPWGDIWTKSLSAITAGNPPDVIVQDINSVKQRAQANQSTDLSKYIDSSAPKKFYPQLWQTVLYKKNPYAIPFNTDTQVIFYNKQIFRAAGIKESQLPTTWHQLWKISHQLDIKKGQTFSRIGFYPMWTLGADVWALNADNGVSWFNDKGQVKINTSNKIQSLEWLKKWQDYYGSATINKLEADFGSGVSDPFISGLVAMRAQNINYYSSLLETAPKNFDFGVIPLPKKTTNSQHWTWGGGFVLEVPHGAKHPKASYEFIKYLASTKVQKKFGEKSFDIMANKKANNELVTDKKLSTKSRMIYRAAVQNFAHTVITPAPLSAPGYNSLVNQEIDQIFLGKQTPRAALNQAQRLVQNLVKQNK